jgi:D-sedoheptulose 7-phosphate isomerase
MAMRENWIKNLEEASRLAAEVANNDSLLKEIEKAAGWISETFQGEGNVFTCGNGGSHCDAMHFAEEWTGRFRHDRAPKGALALGDAAHQTCTGNDFGFSEVFARQLQGLGRKGDLLIGISTSGNSENIHKAFSVAKKMGIRTIGLLGRGGGKLLAEADLGIVVPGDSPERIQELHIKVIHGWVEMVEREIFSDLYE